MAHALTEAESALGIGEVPVGCILINEQFEIVGRGRNNTVASCDATRHAELEAIDRMLHDGYQVRDFGQCTLYVTVEPCIMCACALRHMGIRRVVCGCRNEKFGGCGKSVIAIRQLCSEMMLAVFHRRISAPHL